VFTFVKQKTVQFVVAVMNESVFLSITLADNGDSHATDRRTDRQTHAAFSRVIRH